MSRKDPGLRTAAYETYKAASEAPLMVLALALVPLIVWPLAVDVSPRTEALLTWVDWLIWAVFAADYLIGLSLAPSRRRYVRTEWPNLLLVLLPVLRPLRLLRSSRALRLLRLGRAAAALSEVAQEGRRLLVRHHLHYVLLATLVLVVGGALAMDAAESGGRGPISGFADALWWAASTVTTVGYGDAYPVTPAGRGVALVLMIGGIAFFGVLTANLASFFVERARVTEARTETDLAAKLDEVLVRLAEMEARLGQRDTPA